jgi:hypothetical protein
MDKTMLQILHYMFAKPYYTIRIPVYKTRKKVLRATKPSYAKPVAKQEAKRLQNEKQNHSCEFYPYGYKNIKKRFVGCKTA